MNTAEVQKLVISNGSAAEDVLLAGHLSIYTVSQAKVPFEQVSGALRVDVSGLRRLDTAGAWFLLAQKTPAP